MNPNDVVKTSMWCSSMTYQTFGLGIERILSTFLPQSTPYSMSHTDIYSITLIMINQNTVLLSFKPSTNFLFVHSYVG